jgi:hypothetical protein
MDWWEIESNPFYCPNGGCVIPISPQVRPCDNSCVDITSTTICRFTAGRNRFLPVRP